MAQEFLIKPFDCLLTAGCCVHTPRPLILKQQQLFLFVLIPNESFTLHENMKYL